MINENRYLIPSQSTKGIELDCIALWLSGCYNGLRLRLWLLLLLQIRTSHHGICAGHSHHWRSSSRNHHTTTGGGSTWDSTHHRPHTLHTLHALHAHRHTLHTLQTPESERNKTYVQKEACVPAKFNVFLNKKKYLVKI